MPDRKMRIFLMKNDKMTSENSPDYTGGGEIDKVSLGRIVEAMKMSDTGEVKFEAAGWKNEAKSGKMYLNIQVDVQDPKYAKSDGDQRPASAGDEEAPPF